MSDYVEKLQEDLKKKMDNLSWIHNEPAFHLAEHFAELRRLVDLDAERLLSEMQSAKRNNGKARKDFDVDGTRMEFIRILEELEKRTTQQPNILATSSETYSSLEQRVEHFKVSSHELEDLEDSYVQLAREIIDETNQLEKRIFGDQTIIYWPPKDKDRLGSIVYFGDVFLSRHEIDYLRSKVFSTNKDAGQFLDSSFLVSANRNSCLSKTQLIIESISALNLYRFAEASKFFYCGKTMAEYSGYSAEGSTVEKEFVSYQLAETKQNLGITEWTTVDSTANLFDVYSSESCTLSIRNHRLKSLNTNMLPSSAQRLIRLTLTGVHFESIDTNLLSKFTNLAELKLQITLSKGIVFDLAFLAALTKLETLELTLAHSPSDLSVLNKLTQLKTIKLEGSSFFYAEKSPKLSEVILEHILSAPRLESLTLSYLDIEHVDLEILIEKNIVMNLMTHLYLVDVGIRSLSASSFARMMHLKELSLKGNSIADLPCGVFDHLFQLYSLDLGHNRLRELKKGVFSCLTELTILTLDSNPIESIEADTFVKLRKLLHLSMNRCKLKSIDSAVLNGLGNLVGLRLSNNLIERIEVVTKDGRRINVAKANLSNAERQLIKDHLFKDWSCLSYLFLSGNKLAKLDLDCFSNLIILYKLDLSSNRINELSGRSEPEVLDNCLELLLQDNQLETIHKSVLPIDLRNLDLSKNKLSHLDDDFFEQFTQLRQLNLAQNQLTMDINQETFAGFAHSLEKIDLSQNKSIRVTPGAFKEMINLLGARGECHIKSVHFQKAISASKLTPKVRQALQKLHQFQHHQTNNSQHRASSSSKFLTFSTKKNSSWLTEAQSPETVRFNLSWLWIPARPIELCFSGNIFETLDDPSLFAGFTHLQTISLSDNKLSHVHRDIFKGLGDLDAIDLSRNRLTRVDLGLFRGLESLKHLNLSSNNISFLNLARLFRICPSLQSLNLANNQLDDRSTAEFIDLGISNTLEKLVLAGNRLEKMDMVRDMKCLDHLDLRGNCIKSVMSNGENLLGRLKLLTHLDLSGNRIRELSDEMFAHLRFKLLHLDLSGNPVDFQLDSVLNEFI